MTVLAQATVKMHTTRTEFSGTKTGVAQATQAILISPHTSLFKNYLTARGYKETPVPPVPPVPDTEVSMQAIEPRLPGKRWTANDEGACTARCKRCSQPIIWGQCDTDSRKGSPDVGRWFPLDPDMGLHGCGSGVTRVECDKQRMCYQAGIMQTAPAYVGQTMPDNEKTTNGRACKTDELMAS